MFTVVVETQRSRSLKWGVTNYKELVNTKIEIDSHRDSRKWQRQEIYPVEIVERERGRVKVHYVGYDKAHDEWKDEEELEEIGEEQDTPLPVVKIPKLQVLELYSLYKDLSLRI